jgi:hypothetical protein
MDAFRVLQLMGSVSGVRLALKANRVDGSGADPQGRAATKIRELLTRRSSGQGRDQNPRAAHVGHLTNGRENL